VKESTVDDPPLLDSTGDAGADRCARGVIDRFEAAFPGRVRGYYVEGSRADGSGLASSDLDLTIVFKGGPADEATRQRAARLAEACTALGAVELDVVVEDEARLAAGVPPMFALGSRLLYGEDIRDRVPLLPIEAWSRDRLHAAYWLLVTVFGRRTVVAPPLACPDPASAFHGYANRPVRLADGTAVASTRNLIRVTGWIATARLAREAGRYVARKRDCHALYRRWIGDEWAPLLEEIYLTCRGAWDCRIPADEAERRRLRAICARTLAFENDFLRRYKEFLLAELRTADTPDRAHALRLLARIPYLDEEIAAAVRSCAGADDRPVRAAAGDAARRYREAWAERLADGYGAR
jgi:hypothetical protein